VWKERIVVGGGPVGASAAWYLGEMECEKDEPGEVLRLILAVGSNVRVVLNGSFTLPSGFSGVK
jgi:glycine/D-amino acid oxidase-like deaminating enzyme